MKGFYKISALLLLIFSINIFAQYDDDDDWEQPYAQNSVSVFGQYSMFIGDFGAQYRGGLSIGTTYDYRVTRDFSVGALLEFQRWSDVRNINTNQQVGGIGGTNQMNERNYFGNNKLGVALKGYVPTDGSYDIFVGGIVSYNFTNVITDIPLGAGTGQPGGTQRGNYQRFKAGENALGIDVIGGIRYGFYEDIKLDLSARIGWLGLSDGSVIMAGANFGLVYEF